jgi:hypothetical protein
MGAARSLRLASLALAWSAVFVAAASAQTSRFALDTVAAADVDWGSQVTRHATAWFDLFGAARITDGLDLRARPVVMRRSFDGTWQTQMYELALRYERPGRVGFRVDGGQFASPMGLAILENRPDKNPVISQHSTLYLPIPRYEAGTPTTFLYAAAYPLGAKVAFSGAHWDARAAVIDSSPIRGRPILGDNKPPRMANVVFGAGVTPMIGLRFGAAYATGPYAAVEEVRDKTRGDRTATLTQVEGEWAFRYTRIAGEFLWTTRELATGDATVDGGWIEATQILTPRFSLSARYDDQWTIWTNAAGTETRSPYRRFESALAFRVLPEVTLRASYMTRKGYVVGFWDDQFLAQVVFAKRIK